MSTGADCRIQEREPGKWWYELQQWPYGEWPNYDEFGPFKSEDEAIKHLDRNHANPGGYSVMRFTPKPPCLEPDRCDGSSCVRDIACND